MKINIEVDLTVMELPKDKLAGVYYPNEGNTIIFSKGLNSLEFKEAFLHEIGHLFDWYLSCGEQSLLVETREEIANNFVNNLKKGYIL